MRKIFTKLGAALALMLPAFSVSAGYIEAEMIVSPPNNTIQLGLGNIRINWENTQLVMANDEIGIQNDLNGSDVTILFNGNPFTWWDTSSSMGGGAFYVARLQQVNEKTQKSQVDDCLVIQMPDMAFFNRGEYQITINEGVVTTTTGQTNPKIVLNYTSLNGTSLIEWNPAEKNATFEVGSAIITASWQDPDYGESLTVESIMDDMPIPPFIQATDSGQISCLNKMSVVDGKLQFDFSKTAPGTYDLTLPAGTVMMSNSYGSYTNEEAYYRFKINGETVTVPNATVTQLPGAQNNWLRGVSVQWLENGSPCTLSPTESLANDIDLMDGSGKNLDVTISLSDDAKTLYILCDEFQFGTSYSVSIPANGVTITLANGIEVMNNATSPSISLGNTVLTLPEAVFSPSASEPLENLSTVEINWGQYLLNSTGSGVVSVTLDGAAYNNFTTSIAWDQEKNKVIGAEGNVLQVTFPQIDKAGTYVITVPAGYVHVTDINGNSNTNSSVSLTYQVDKTLPTPMVTPAQNSTVSAITNITVSWDGAEIELGSQVATLTFEGNAIDLTGKIENNQNNYSLVFDLSSAPCLDAGDYVLNIPADYVTLPDYYSKGNSILTATITVVSDYLDNPQILPAENEDLTNIEEINLTWTTDGSLALNENAGEITVTFDNEIIQNVIVNTTVKDNTLTLAFDEALVYPGDYVITVPADLLRAITGVNTAVSTNKVDINYTIGWPEIPEVSVSPAEETTLTALVSITASWNDEEITLNEESSGNVTLTYGDKSAEAVSASINADNNALVIELGSSAIAPGNYTVTIPAGFITFPGLFGQTLESELTFIYTVEPMILSEPAIQPVANENAEEVTAVTFTWTSDAKLFVNPNFKGEEGVSVTFGGIEYSGTFTTNLENNVLSVILDEPQTEAGRYEVSVAEGYLIGLTAENEGVMNGESSVSYTIAEPEVIIEVLDMEPSVTPATGSTVETLTSITVNWGLPIEINPFAESATFNNEPVAALIEDMTLIFNVEVTEDGEYTLEIPEAFIIMTMTMTGMPYYNAATSVTIKVKAPQNPETGVAGIEADASGLYRVYNIQGANVMTTDNANAIKALNKGLYIINGKKVVIK